MKTKVIIAHEKRLAHDQFDAIKGSAQHASMIMNKVHIKIEQKWPRNNEALAFNFEQVENFLLCSCSNYYFIGSSNSSGVGNNERRYYFLSKADMEEFLVWAKLALPLSDDG